MPRRSPPPLVLPNGLDPIAYIIGLDEAMRLARKLQACPSRDSKLCLYIPTPARLGDDHWLVRQLGEEKAAAICEEMAPDHWWPPCGDSIESAICARQILDLDEIGLPDSRRLSVRPYLM